MTTTEYKKYNSVVESNVWNDNIVINKHELGNVLITGANGFLAMHVIEALLATGNVNTIYCVVRGKNGEHANDRFADSLHYYFDEKFDKHLEDKIVVISGDITDDSFVEKFSDLKIDTIFHIAANTNHYGFMSDFYNTNTVGTEKVCTLSSKLRAYLVYISTLSICYNFKDGRSDKTFSENQFYIDQDLGNNVYVFSKVLAEKAVLEYLQNNKGVVIRLASQNNRYNDAKSMRNVEKNHFLQNLRSILKIGYLTDQRIDNLTFQMDAVDCIAEGIVKLAEYRSEKANVFHLFNEEYKQLRELIDIFEKYGHPIKIVSEEEFLDLIKDKNKEISELMVMDEMNNGSVPVYRNSFTKKYLKKIEFKLKKIDSAYLDRFVKYYDDIGFWD